MSRHHQAENWLSRRKQAVFCHRFEREVQRSKYSGCLLSVASPNRRAQEKTREDGGGEGSSVSLGGKDIVPSSLQSSLAGFL